MSDTPSPGWRPYPWRPLFWRDLRLVWDYLQVLNDQSDEQKIQLSALEDALAALNTASKEDLTRSYRHGFS